MKRSIRHLQSLINEKTLEYRFSKESEKLLPADERKLLAGQKGFVYDFASLMVIMTLSGGSYLAGLLDLAGLPKNLSGLVLSLPVLAGVFQILGAMISLKLHTQKKFVLAGIVIHRLSMALIFFMPLFGKGLWVAIAIVIIYAIGFFVGTMIGPSAGNWLMSVVKTEKRAEFFSFRERIGLIVAAVAMLISSQILDAFKYSGLVNAGFAALGVIILAFSVLNIWKISTTPEPKSMLERSRFSLKLLVEPFKNEKFLKVIFIFVLWNVATQISLPFLGLYFIDNIGLSFGLLGTLGMIATLEKALIVNWWGKLASKTSWLKITRYLLLIFILSMLLLLVMTRKNGAVVFAIHTLIANVAFSAFGMAFFNIQFEYLDPAKSTYYMGVCGAMSGIAGFGAALLGTRILSIVNSLGLFLNGVQVLVVLSCILLGIMLLVIRKEV